MSASVTVRPGDSYSSPTWMSSKYRRESAMDTSGYHAAGGPLFARTFQKFFEKPHRHPCKEARDDGVTPYTPQFLEGRRHGSGARECADGVRANGTREVGHAQDRPVDPLRAGLRRVVRQEILPRVGAEERGEGRR